MHYYYLDQIDNHIEEYKDEKEFIEGLTWNHEVAVDNGDDVAPLNEIIQAFKNNDEYESDSINGAYFYKSRKPLDEFEKEVTA